MSKTRNLFTFVLGIAVAAPSAFAASTNAFSWSTAPQAQSYRSAGDDTVAARAAEMAARGRVLETREVAKGLREPLVVRVSAADRAAIADPGTQERRYRVGISKEVGVAVDFSSLAPRDIRSRAQALTFGAIQRTGDGGFVWSAAVRSPEASALRLQLSGVDLPRGAALFVYNRQGQAFGPYTGVGPLGSGEFWTHTVFGDTMYLQLRQEGPVTRDVLSATRFVIAEVGVMGDRFRAAGSGIGGGSLAERAYCADNAACVLGADCTSTSGAVADARDAVAHMLFQSGRYYYICSGGLMADTIQSGRPYFLTANHCISRGREAASLETYFQYKDPNCTCPAPGYRNYDTLGATILSSSSTSDYTLMELSGPPPSGSAYLGWDANPVAFANGTTLYRISHPSGSPQSYSEHAVDTSKGTCQTWPRGNWIYSRDTKGATEGGSSGSPVVNGSGLVVGQLSGACGTNVNDNCDAQNNATVDGALAAYFDQVAQWLDPQGGGGCTPTGAEICDGIDNDCNGQIDEGGVCGGTCTPSGDACTSNSECCSSNCKGKPGSKTCK